MSSEKYVPALRFKWLTSLYDFIVRITMPEKKIKTRLVETAGISAGQKILDFGCGTGTLTIMAKQASPDANITGIDIDVEILNKATQKASEKKIDISLIEYDGKKLPFQSNHFNRVISCLVFHHLNTETKKKILAELHRTIISNGELYIADFGRSKSWVQRKLFNIIRVLDGFKPTEANAKGILPDFIQEAGFIYVSIIERFKTIFGEVQLLRATKQ